MTLLQDLLTENRYWTFSSLDWNKRVNVWWNGSISFADVKETIKLKYFPNEDFYYERQIELKEPDIKFL